MERLADGIFEKGKILVDETSWNQYAKGIFSQRARAVLYEKFGSRNFDSEVSTAIALQPGETLLDVGCGNGVALLKMAEAGHQGSLIGVDRFARAFRTVQRKVELAKEDTRSLIDSQLDNIEFYQADARNLAMLDDESVDVVVAKDLLYHVGEPEKALDEFRRVLKPAGRLIVATKGDFNQIRIWGFARRIVKYLQEQYPGKYPNLQPPETFYNQFDLSIALAELDKRFVRDDPHNDYDSSEFVKKSQTPLFIPKNYWGEYRLAIYSVLELLEPEVNYEDIEEYLDGEVREIFEAEISAAVNVPKGNLAYGGLACFREESERYILRYRKTPSTLSRSLGCGVKHCLKNQQ